MLLLSFGSSCEQSDVVIEECFKQKSVVSEQDILLESEHQKNISSQVLGSMFCDANRSSSSPKKTLSHQAG